MLVREGLPSDLAREDLDVVPMDCGHNDCLSVWPETVRVVSAFLRAHGILEDEGG